MNPVFYRNIYSNQRKLLVIIDEKRIFTLYLTIQTNFISWGIYKM